MNHRFNSLVDRRWARHFQRVQERKDLYLDYDSGRKERREQRRKDVKEARAYYTSYGFDPQMMCTEKVAVSCHSYNELNAVIRETRRKFPEYVPPDSDLARCFWNEQADETVVGICESEYWFLHSVKEIRDYGRSWFLSNGYEVVDFYDCCKARDLGRICAADSIDDLFGEGVL